jgi:hypothetical protein
LMIEKFVPQMRAIRSSRPSSELKWRRDVRVQGFSGFRGISKGEGSGVHEVNP